MSFLIFIIFTITLPLPTLTKVPTNFFNSSNLADLKKPTGKRTNLKAKDYPILRPKYLPPKFFDARKKWPECESIRTPPDGGDCRYGHWALAVTSVISDRWCIRYGPKEQRLFSAEDLTTCCAECQALAGGRHGCMVGMPPEEAYYYWVNTGIVSGGPYNSSIGCKPFSENLYENRYKEKKTCEERCYNESYPVPYAKDKRKGYDVNLIVSRDIQRIQWEIFINGPVQTMFWWAHDFEDINCDEVYFSKNNKGTGLLNFVIIGWGEEKGLPYWLIKNSWGKDWCNGGFFKLKRGDNEGDSEARVYVPIIERSSQTLVTTEPPEASRVSSVLKATNYVLIILYFVTFSTTMNF